MAWYRLKFIFTFTAERRTENDLKWLQDFRAFSNIKKVNVNVKVKQSHYRPGKTQRVPGS